MSDRAIECESLSKRYLIGHSERYTALRDRLSPGYLARRLLGRVKTSSEEFWALKDISFEVAPGEAVAIIGRNGAGKSTLLKVLSRIAAPTGGEARIRGRVASLLEVGTGFHPELTGRENIFLNGAILGMKRADIARKLDAIVDFSGVEKFLDTPVKRYSSGMYVRLAFAVAAHLEPEILIVDEVLAVGDADFQRKCLGKMQEAGRDNGRTILFVSHNMTAVQSLCKRAIWIDGGKVREEGEASRIVASYLRRHGTEALERVWTDEATAPGNEEARVRAIRVVPQAKSSHDSIDTRTPLLVEFDFVSYVDGAQLNLTWHLNTLAGECVFALGGAHGKYGRGAHRITCLIPGDLLNDNTYTLSPYLVKESSRAIIVITDAVTFQVNDAPREGAWMGKLPGIVRPTAFLRWDAMGLDEATLLEELKAHDELKPNGSAHSRIAIQAGG